MNPKDRVNELTFHKGFSKQDFETDCKVFKVWKDLFKHKKEQYEWIVDYYFDLQKRAAKGELTMKEVQKRLYSTIVTSLDRKTAVALPKTIIKHLGVRKAMQVIKVLKGMGLK